MGDLRATETWYGRAVDPAAEYVDSAAAPVKYVHHPYPYPAETVAPPPPDAPRGPPVPIRDPYAYDPYPPPRHFLPPYDAVPPPREAMPPPREAVPPPRAAGPPPPTRPVVIRELPPYEVPADMVIPGVQHPDGHFEPHPAYVRRAPLAPAVVEEPLLPEVPAKHVTELNVPVCCEACKERITNYVGEVDGVDEVLCDVNQQKVKVVSDIAPADVLQLCKKCFRKSTIIS